jgi:hypothetical protein
VSCEDARELFSALADQALTAAERARVDAHLAACGECAREWQRFEAAVSLLRSVEPARAPAGFVDRVLAARPQPWYRRLGRALLVPWPVKLPLQAAAIVMIAGLAVVIVQSSPDLRRAMRAPEPPAPMSGPRHESNDRLTRREQPAAPAPGAGVGDPAATAAPDEARAKRAEPGRQVGRDAALAERPPAAEPPAKGEAASAESAGARVGEHAPPPDVGARLAGVEPDVTARELQALVTRLGGTVTAAGPEVVAIAVPRGAWDELLRELGRLGTLHVDPQPADLPPTVRLALRLER